MPFNPAKVDIISTMKDSTDEFNALLENYKESITQNPDNIKYMDTIRTIRYLYAYYHLGAITQKLIMKRRQYEKHYGSITPVERISIFVSMISKVYDTLYDTLPPFMQDDLDIILYNMRSRPLPTKNGKAYTHMSKSMLALISMRQYIYDHHLTVRKFDPQVQQLENHLLHKLNRWYFNYTNPNPQLQNIIKQVKELTITTPIERM